MKQKSSNYRYQLFLEFDGTNFSGWQRQKDARTVQGDLYKGLQKLLGDTVVDLQGCGRTDAGVHGQNYCAHIEVSQQFDSAGFVASLNDQLPKDLAVIAVQPADPRFHARHSCLARVYNYRLSLRKSAFGKRYSWWVRDRLDLLDMREAALEMVGMLDYRAFAEKQELKKSTLVKVEAIQLLEEDGGVVIRVVGSHFLWRMVRRMVGILVEVGRGGLSRAQVTALFTGPSELPAQHTAPAAGLFFAQAFYDQDELDLWLRSIK